MKVGILSDTHDLLRPTVLEKLACCSHILHAGDISSQGILDQLNVIAPVIAVRGNNDGEWAGALPLRLSFELGGLSVLMAHKRKDLPEDLTPYDLVVFGHSHRYEATWLEPAGVHRTLLLNPGSCGPRRFAQPITMAVLTVESGGFVAERVDIPHQAKETRPDAVPDLKAQIGLIVRETQKGLTVQAIARRHGLDPGLTEQVVRLYVTHPGVTADGIMRKMGL